MNIKNYFDNQYKLFPKEEFPRTSPWGPIGTVLSLPCIISQRRVPSKNDPRGLSFVWVFSVPYLFSQQRVRKNLSEVSHCLNTFFLLYYKFDSHTPRPTTLSKNTLLIDLVDRSVGPFTSEILVYFFFSFFFLTFLAIRRDSFSKKNCTNEAILELVVRT